MKMFLLYVLSIIGLVGVVDVLMFGGKIGVYFASILPWGKER